MSERPTRHTVAGARYLDLRRLAGESGRPTDELLQFFALEGFLDRLARSPHAGDMVLKGGVLLAAFGARRPTRDIDLASTVADDGLQALRGVVDRILEVDVEDGLVLDPRSVSVSAIRDGESSSGIRVGISGGLATARIRFHVDLNAGDPLWPPPEPIEVPRLLGGPPIEVLGYRLELVLAEKIVTALQRGSANTRWRDFVDIAELVGRDVDPEGLAESIRRVAVYRRVQVRPLSDVLEGFADRAQGRWEAWRRRQGLFDAPESFADLLDVVVESSDDHLRRARG